MNLMNKKPNASRRPLPLQPKNHHQIKSMKVATGHQVRTNNPKEKMKTLTAKKSNYWHQTIRKTWLTVNTLLMEI